MSIWDSTTMEESRWPNLTESRHWIDPYCADAERSRALATAAFKRRRPLHLEGFHSTFLIFLNILKLYTQLKAFSRKLKSPSETSIVSNVLHVIPDQWFTLVVSLMIFVQTSWRSCNKKLTQQLKAFSRKLKSPSETSIVSNVLHVIPDQWFTLVVSLMIFVQTSWRSCNKKLTQQLKNAGFERPQ